MSNVAVFLANGFEEVEALTVVDYLRRANIHVKTVSIHDTDIVEGSHNIKVLADINLVDFRLEEYDCVVFPGGMPGTKHLYENEKVLKIVKNAYEEKRWIGAICAAPLVLYYAKILDKKHVTSYPSVKNDLTNVNYHEDKVVQDGNIITSQSAATAVDFALKLIEVLSGVEVRNNIKESILYQS